MEFMPGIRINCFTLKRQLGHGRTGEVWEAVVHELPTPEHCVELREDAQLDVGDVVALKVLVPDAVRSLDVAARFEREIRLLMALSHPAVVRTLGHGRFEGRRLFAMEYVAGETLRDWMREYDLASSGPRKPLAIIVAVLEALAYIHEQGVVHRDLKPANVLIVDDGGESGQPTIKLLDFGFAKLFDDQEGLTASGIFLGTPGYVAPEQLRGSGRVDARTDLYAAGVIAYELLAGRRPYQGESASETAFAQTFQTATPLSKLQADVPPALDELILQAVTRDMDRRPATATDFRTRLSRIAASPMMTVYERRLAPDKNRVNQPVRLNDIRKRLDDRR